MARYATLLIVLVAVLATRAAHGAFSCESPNIANVTGECLQINPDYVVKYSYGGGNVNIRLLAPYYKAPSWMAVSFGLGPANEDVAVVQIFPDGSSTTQVIYDMNSSPPDNIPKNDTTNDWQLSGYATDGESSEMVANLIRVAATTDVVEDLPLYGEVRYTVSAGSGTGYFDATTWTTTAASVNGTLTGVPPAPAEPADPPPAPNGAYAMYQSLLVVILAVAMTQWLALNA